MFKMIRDLKAADNSTVLHSLPESWENMKIIMTHNDTVKTFSQLTHHLELEDECRNAASNDVAAILVFKPNTFKSRPKKNKGKGKTPLNKVKDNQEKGKKRRCGKRGGQKENRKIKCYNCKKLGHIARDCTEPIKVSSNTLIYHSCNVRSEVLMAPSHSFCWIADSYSWEITRPKIFWELGLISSFFRTGQTLIFNDVHNKTLIVICSSTG